MPTLFESLCACRCECQGRELITLLGLTRSAAAALCAGTGTSIFTHRNGAETTETCPGGYPGGATGADLIAAVIAEARAQPWTSGPGTSIHLVDSTRAEYSEGRFQLILSIPIMQAPPVEVTISGGWVNWRGVPFAETVVAEGRAILTWSEDALEHRIFRSEWLDVQTASEGQHSFIELAPPRGICLDGWGG